MNDDLSIQIEKLKEAYLNSVDHGLEIENNFKNNLKIVEESERIAK